MSRKDILLLCIFSFLLLVSFCQASSVSRTFSKNITNPGENITVNLTVSITAPQDTYYAIDEIYPSGWIVMSTTGDTNQSGHIKWAVIQNAVNINHTYVVGASADAGTYTFSGLYMFNTTYPSELAISGQTQVQVTGVCVNSTFYRDSDSDGYGNASWAVQNCTAPADYVGNSLDCNDTNPAMHPGVSDICGNGIDEDCSGSDSACQPPPSGPSGPSGSSGPSGPAPACTNNQTRNCSISHKGRCASGTETCINGNWTGCPTASSEICNHIDDDCDNQTDESLICECFGGESRACGSNVGECREGTRTCRGGLWGECIGGIGPSAETCNAKDDDCDGTVDNNCTQATNICQDGLIPEAGCQCGDKFYTIGFCFGGVYSETGPAEFPWITVTIFGVMIILILTMAIIYKEFHKKGKKDITWEDLMNKYNKYKSSLLPSR
jgi:hypothetical protein